MYGAAIVALGPGPDGGTGTKVAKSPESLRVNELFQTFTLLAVLSDIVSNVTIPPKSMSPTIGLGGG
jgi:hypothetical protein